MEAHINTVQIVNRYEERMYEDPLLDHMRDQGAMDTQYSQVIQAIRNKKQKAWVLATSDNPCRDYVSVWDHLGLLDKKDSTLLTLDIKRKKPWKSYTTATKESQKHTLLQGPDTIGLH